MGLKFQGKEKESRNLFQTSRGKKEKGPEQWFPMARRLKGEKMEQSGFEAQWSIGRGLKIKS